MIAFERGRDVAQRYRLEPRANLRPLLGEIGIEVVPWRFHGRVREVIVEGCVGIDDRLSEAWTRWLTAHALGHHLLHTGASLYLESWQWVSKVKAERQAEEFAAGLLSADVRVRPASPRALARRLGIPEAKAAFILTILGLSGSPA